MFTVDRDKCTGCGSCSNVCPQGAISIEDNLAVINEGLCVGCGACASVCPTGAIRELEPQREVWKGGEDAVWKSLAGERLG